MQIYPQKERKKRNLRKKKNASSIFTFFKEMWEKKYKFDLFFSFTLFYLSFIFKFYP